jgi:4-hydroxybenzoate polyprenyltransferase
MKKINNTWLRVTLIVITCLVSILITLVLVTEPIILLENIVLEKTLIILILFGSLIQIIFKLVNKIVDNDFDKHHKKIP